MGMKTDIYNDNRLRFGETSAPFVIKKAEEMRMEIASVPHRHSYYTVLWSFNDEGQHVVDMQTYPFHMQTVFCIMPGQVHCIVPPQPKGIMLLFTPEFLASKVSDGGFLSKLDFMHSKGEPLQLSEESSEALMDHAIAMTDAFFSSNLLKHEIIEAHLKLFLLACNEQWLLTHKFPDGAIICIHPAVRSFKKMVEQHLSEWHKVDDYANALCLSSNYLSEVVRKALGQSPKEYINTQLMIEAKRLALFSDFSMKEIGFQLGFDEPARFSRFFKEHGGISFQAFKQSIF
jgi:AraC-like DNA-binding protein